MMDSKVLSPDAVLEVKRLYAQKTEHGRRIWSHARLAKQFGVGETTIYRALNGYGTFERAPTPLPDTPEVAAKIAASQAKLLAMLADNNQPGAQNNVKIDPPRLNPETGAELGERERWDPIGKRVITVPY